MQDKKSKKHRCISRRFLAHAAAKLLLDHPSLSSSNWPSSKPYHLSSLPTQLSPHAVCNGGCGVSLSNEISEELASSVHIIHA
eukprot:CCRYP_014790-RF/>CCRYP_014790-RF protein AED:0.48 eAED:0.67 QI:7/0/0.5/1/1/1/2/0/82